MVNSQWLLFFATEATVIIKSAKGFPFFGSVIPAVSYLTRPPTLSNFNRLFQVTSSPLAIHLPDFISIGVLPVLARLLSFFWVRETIRFFWIGLLPELLFFSCCGASFLSIYPYTILTMALQGIWTTTVLVEILKRGGFQFITFATFFVRGFGHDEYTSRAMIKQLSYSCDPPIITHLF